MKSTSRGSLIECVAKCLTIFKDASHPYLSIFHNPRGKYYMIATDYEVNDLSQSDEFGHIRLVMRITEKELRVVLRGPLEQTRLDLNGDNAKAGGS